MAHNKARRLPETGTIQFYVHDLESPLADDLYDAGAKKPFRGDRLFNVSNESAAIAIADAYGIEIPETLSLPGERFP